MYNITACRRYGGSGRLTSAYLDGIGSRKSNSSSCSSWLMVLFKDGCGSPVLKAEKNGWSSCNERAVEPVGNNISGYVSIGHPYCKINKIISSTCVEIYKCYKHKIYLKAKSMFICIEYVFVLPLNP